MQAVQAVLVPTVKRMNKRSLPAKEDHQNIPALSYLRRRNTYIVDPSACSIYDGNRKIGTRELLLHYGRSNHPRSWCCHQLSCDWIELTGEANIRCITEFSHRTF